MSVGGWAEVMRVLKALERLMEATLLCDGESVVRGLDKLVGENYDRENANKPHSCVIERMEKQAEHFL